MNLVLGGTSGLGAEIVAELHARGEETFVIGSSYTEAEHGQGMRVNLAQEDEVYGFNEYLQARNVGGLTIRRFFWTAGIGYNGDFVDQPNAHEMALVNFANVVPIAQEVWRIMLEQTTPSNFVIVSSSTGLKARADEAVYAGTKHAQVGYGKSLGLESERLHAPIRVAVFEPGGMKTPFWDKNKQQRPANYHEFLEPAKVAAHILELVFAQEKPLLEKEIPKGSL